MWGFHSITNRFSTQAATFRKPRISTRNHHFSATTIRQSDSQMLTPLIAVIGSGAHCGWRPKPSAFQIGGSGSPRTLSAHRRSGLLLHFDVSLPFVVVEAQI